MYSHCLFCHTALGRNESIEHFPVGRRLAFDGANGRFWVICAACKRWNLSPLEERWAAVDECERLFERTRTRLSTDNIGLARIAEGTELVIAYVEKFWCPTLSSEDMCSGSAAVERGSG